MRTLPVIFLIGSAVIAASAHAELISCEGADGRRVLRDSSDCATVRPKVKVPPVVRQVESTRVVLTPAEAKAAQRAQVAAMKAAERAQEAARQQAIGDRYMEANRQNAALVKRIVEKPVTRPTEKAIAEDIRVRRMAECAARHEATLCR